MTLPATKKSLTVESTAALAERARGSEPPPQGWDPFEVWRTRIYLPRLAEAAAEQEKLDVSSPTQLLEG